MLLARGGARSSNPLRTAISLLYNTHISLNRFIFRSRVTLSELQSAVATPAMLRKRCATPTMHTVQPALERGTADRPAGPALGTAVPAEGWHWLALGHWSASRRLALARTGHPVPAPVEALGTAVLL